jgi:hypothetical protein
MPRRLLACLFVLMLACAPAAFAADAPAKRDVSAQKKLGWRLAAQAWTFRAMSLTETIDTLHSLDLHYIEMYPGQKLAPTATRSSTTTPPRNSATR